MKWIFFNSHLAKNKLEIYPSRQSQYVLSIAATSVVTPKTVIKALEIPEQKKAMQLEYEAMNKNKTWKLVPRSSSDNAI